MQTTTIEFNGIEFIVSVDADDADARGHRAIISYPTIEESGFDPSAGSEDNYPTAEIEAFVSRCIGRTVKFADCMDAGCDAAAWESWIFREVEPANGARTALDLAEALVLNDLDAMDPSDRAECLADCAAGSPDACACEWLIRDICEQFWVSEALADQACDLYPAACQRLAAEALADEALVALHNGARTVAVDEMTDEQVALCIREAATLDADILAAEDGAHDSDREYVAAYAAAYAARFSAIWTLP